MASKQGIRRAVIVEPGYVSGTDPQALVVLGGRVNAGKLVIEDDAIALQSGRKLPNMYKHSFAAEIVNTSRPVLPALLLMAREGGAGVELIGARKTVTPATYDGVFTYIGQNRLGMKMKYKASNKARTIEIELKRLFDKDTHKAILDAAQTDTIQTFGASVGTQLAEVSADPDNYTPTGYAEFNLGGTLLFDNADLKEFKLEVETAGDENIFEMLNVSYLNTKLEVTITNASREKIKSLHEFTSLTPAIDFTLKNGANKWEKHVYNQGVLSLNRVTTIGDDERTVKLVFEGQTPINMVTVVAASENLTVTHAL